MCLELLDLNENVKLAKSQVTRRRTVNYHVIEVIEVIEEIENGQGFL